MMDAEGVAFMTDVADEVQRWMARRKAAVVMSIVKGETSAAEAGRKHSLTIAETERWSEQSFAPGENALRVWPRVQGRRSIAPSSNSRWATDLTHIYCGDDGWGHLAAIIDRCDREIVG